MKVELLYDEGCPNVDAAREDLRAAFAAVGLEARWVERRSDGGAHGSPTVLVDGADVLPESAVAAGGAACRVYREEGGAIRRSPGVGPIASSIRRARLREGNAS